MQQGNEYAHNDVYGKTFELYGRDEIEAFIVPFRTRFIRNNLNAKHIFAGKKCLDAGCGGGRGSLFMAENDADRVDAVDISDENIINTQKSAHLFSYKNIQTNKQSLSALPYPDQHFDIVFCNGVLMHTHNPDHSLKEISRVLKIGGHMWVYVYGAGGTYWHCVNLFRRFFDDHSTAELIAKLQELKTDTSYLAEYLDNWKTPYLRKYTQSDFSNRLKALGFGTVFPLLRGTDYDTSERRNKFVQDADFVGEGDLRYFLTKQDHFLGDQHAISNNAWGSNYTHPYPRQNDLEETLCRYNSVLEEKGLKAQLSGMAKIQRFIRDEMFNQNTPFDIDRFLSFIEECITKA